MRLPNIVQSKKEKEEQKAGDLEPLPPSLDRERSSFFPQTTEAYAASEKVNYAN